MTYDLEALDVWVRQELDEISIVRYTPIEVTSAINDGYREVAALAQCYEVTQEVVTFPGSPLIRWSGVRIIQASVMAEDVDVAFVDTTGVEFTDTGDVIWNQPVSPGWIGLGICCINPQFVGTTKLQESVTHPQFYFAWGNCMYVEPVPQEKYLIRLFTAQYPDDALVAPTDVCSDLPEDFRECIVYFACYVLSMKYRKWQEMVFFYNRYISVLQQRRQELRARQMVEHYDTKKMPVKVRVEVAR